jgi:hypothetical protein
MKSLVLTALLLCPLAAQSFVNGQAARLIIGQPNFTAQRTTPTNASILGGVSGLAYANDTLFVADANRVGAAPDNHRVLIYRNVSTYVPALTAPLEQNGRCPACLGPANVVVGQSNFETIAIGRDQRGLRLPTAVATDGTRLAVADTDNNRILIWNTIPGGNGQAASVVVGQSAFNTFRAPGTDQKTLRGPQGVWIQNGRLFVADTMNHRVLIWNTIPTQNDAPADVVLGQANFTSAPQPDLTKASLNAQNNTMLNPVAVTSDGVRLFVTDLGHNRVLIWNRIPTSNQAPADVVLGQPDFTSATANNSSKLCTSTGKDSSGNNLFPRRCGATLNFPRYALSDGRRLFVADGGNDRVLVWNSIPVQSGQPADVVLGQLAADINNTSDSAYPERVSASDVLRTPMSLAWDGANLYVSDVYNRRVLVFTPADAKVPYTGVRNSASRAIYAVGVVTLAGEVKEGQEITLKIEAKEYKYKTIKDDTFAKVIRALVDVVNAGAGDPLVLATTNLALNQLVLTARESGPAGNDVDMSVTLSTDATITATTSSATLTGGQDAARIAAGTLVTILGDRLTDRTAAVPENTTPLPREIQGVRVYFDGIEAPLVSVSPTEIVAQLPWEVQDAESSNAVVRSVLRDGSISVSSAVNVSLIRQNPGIFALPGVDPRPGLVYHGSSFAQATVIVEGSAKENDRITLVIGDREYTYTLKANDTLINLRDGLIDAVNRSNDGNGDPDVFAFRAGVFRRIILRAKRPGPDLNGLPVTVRSNDGASAVVQTTNSELCCANVQGAPVTEANPAIPGETIIVYATGLGKVLPVEVQAEVKTGEVFTGSADNEPEEFVSSLAGGKTANVLFARLIPGRIGIYEVVLELNSDLPTNPNTQLTIAQSFQVSNIVGIAIRNPKEN